MKWKRNKVYLSGKYLDIVQLLCEGETSKDISERIGISPRTVETYISDMLVAFDCKNSCHLVAKYLRRLIN